MRAVETRYQKVSTEGVCSLNIADAEIVKFKRNFFHCPRCVRLSLSCFCLTLSLLTLLSPSLSLSVPLEILIDDDDGIDCEKEEVVAESS